MLKLIYAVFKDFGTSGLVVAFGLLNFYWIYKVATNHLSHIASDIKSVKQDVKDVKDDVKDLDDKIVVVGNRTSRLEGKVENLI